MTSGKTHGKDWRKVIGVRGGGRWIIKLHECFCSNIPCRNLFFGGITFIFFSLSWEIDRKLWSVHNFFASKDILVYDFISARFFPGDVHLFWESSC